MLCVAIAGLLEAVGSESTFAENLIVSLCIGYSICSISMLLWPRLQDRLPAGVGELLTLSIGLVIGLALGGWAVTGSPQFFFVEDTSTLVVGIFFGMLGTAVFTTVQRIADLRERLAKAAVTQLTQEKQLLETELKLLQAQIEPHFLFNTLSNVVGLIRPDPETATRALEHLTTLLRAALQRTRSTPSSLADEMEIVRAYLEIQRIRMGARLRYEVLGTEAFQTTPLPPLLLQPLVENAVKHGIDPAEAGGNIVISAYRAGAHLALRVADDGVGASDMGAGMRTGLRNVRERLAGLYGAAASLEVAENRPHGFIATIQIPLPDAA